MAERDLIQQLDQAVEALLGREAAAPTGPEVTDLLRIAADVRHLPDEDFRANLRAQLISRATKERKNMPTATESWIREGFRTLTPYLHAPASARLMEFMKEAFGAQEIFRAPRPDGTIMHAEVKIGDSILEMGEIPPDQWKGLLTPLHVYVPDVDAVYARALAAGGTSLGEPRDHEYGERGANVKDPGGNHWYLATAKGPHYIPEGLHNVNLALHPRGAPAFIDFLKKAFGAEEKERHESEGTVRHATVKIGDSILEMGEAHGPWQPMPCAIHMYVPDADETYRRAVEAGATSISAPVDQPYGERSGGVIDPQGNYWYIATTISKTAG